MSAIHVWRRQGNCFRYVYLLSLHFQAGRQISEKMCLPEIEGNNFGNQNILQIHRKLCFNNMLLFDSMFVFISRTNLQKEELYSSFIHSEPESLQ